MVICFVAVMWREKHTSQLLLASLKLYDLLQREHQYFCARFDIWVF